MERNNPEGPDMSDPGAGYVGPARTCLARDQICPVRTYPLSKTSTNHVFLLGFLSNLIQRLTSTLGTTYSKDKTCIVGLTSRTHD
jgi:hypothetical protein